MIDRLKIRPHPKFQAARTADQCVKEALDFRVKSDF